MIFCSKNTSVFCLRSCLCIVDLKSGNYVELMSQSHSETTDEAFQAQCILWERGTSVGVDFFLSFRIAYMHTNPYETS